MAQPLRIATEDPDDDDDLSGHERSPAAMPAWERRLVVGSLVVHVADVWSDILVLILFFVEGYTNFGTGSGLVVLWACAASSLYMSCGSGGGSRDDPNIDGIDGPGISRKRQVINFICNLSQVQIFSEAYRCLFHRHDGDFFHTLRLMEAILEAAPNALVQLYALAYWPSSGMLSDYGSMLLTISVLISFMSVGLSFAMFEQKVQGQATSGYVMCVALMRMFEIASRSITLALFSTLTYSYGFWWALFLDYSVMVCLTIKHKSVRSSYSFFLAVPLVLMSYEPVVWRREDHVVPKDRYYVVRMIEFVIMWISIKMLQDGVPADTPLSTFITESPIWSGMSFYSWCSTTGLFLTLPCIYRVARRYELSRDGIGNDDFDPLEQGERDFYSDSDGSHSRDYESEDDEDAQAQEGLLSGEANKHDVSTDQQE
jgi:hypothetical protein